jgi:hypothetical protein
MPVSISRRTADIQSELEALYRSELVATREAFTDADLAALSFPFLLNVSPDYLAAPVKLMRSVWMMWRSNSEWPHRAGSKATNAFSSASQRRPLASR